MKVYLVSHGEYSDYQIDGVFSTSDKADAYIGPSKEHYAAEWEVDDPEVVSNPQVTMYHVAINMDTGDDIDENCTVVNNYGQRSDSFISGGVSCAVAYSPVSFDHAHKLAVEFRQAYLRKKGVV